MKQHSNSQRPILRHMIQLDGLRTFAVLAVLFSHFAGAGNLVALTLPWGTMGVRLFFVLSGFLITGILLQCREHKEAGRSTRGQLLGKFYARRFLRIFPVYYAALFAVTLVNIRPVRDVFWWHLTYTSNFYYALHGFQGPGSHFWSLAVEEQFYLVWPWLILFTPQRWLAPLNVAIVALAVSFRSLGVLLGWDNVLDLQILPIGCLDALGLGSLLAVLTSGGRTWSQRAHSFANISFWCGLSLLAFLSLAKGVAWGQKLAVALEVWGMALVFVALVAWGARGMGGAAGKLLGWRPLVYIGKISYGVYIYHGFMPVVGPRLFGLFGLHSFYQHFDGLLNTVLTLLVAAASWHFFESPINRLKERFSYMGERGKPASGGLAPAGSVVSKRV